MFSITTVESPLRSIEKIKKEKVFQIFCCGHFVQQLELRIGHA